MRFDRLSFRDAGLMVFGGVLALSAAFASAELAHHLTGSEHARVSMTALALSD